MANWRAALQGITSNLAPYNPIYTTIDYACQYARAIHTSNIASATYDPVTKQTVTTFSGKRRTCRPSFICMSMTAIRSGRLWWMCQPSMVPPWSTSPFRGRLTTYGHTFFSKRGSRRHPTVHCYRV